MVQIAIEELIDINPWHGLRFGNLVPVQDAGIDRYYVSGNNYEVSQSKGQLEVRRDGRFLVASDGPVEIRNVKFERDRMSFQVRAAHTVKVRAARGLSREYQPGVTSVSEVSL